MRIDDRLDTALRESKISGNSLDGGQWRQLIDILAQNPKSFASEKVASGLVRVCELRDSLTVGERVATLRSLDGRISSAPLVRLLVGDDPAVGAAAISAARLSDEQWADLIPHLPVRARGFLRLRRDLGAPVQRALAVFSAGDFLLPQSEAEVTPEEADLSTGQQQPLRPALRPWEVPRAPIGAIVDRIEKWRQDHAINDAPQLPFIEQNQVDETVTEIRFETDDNGAIVWVEGAPGGAIVGIDIARPAYDSGPGPDAYGAAAFRQRMPMENARMRLRGTSQVEGEWRISAAPFFDAVSGRFRGFRGIMRRPILTETAALHPDLSAQTEQLQQTLHELRTPLGAIVGFAEIIEQQLFGEVSQAYRALAADILEDANRLLAGFDDIMMSAEIDTGQFQLARGVTECDWLTERLAQRLEAVSDSLGVDVNLVIADPVRPFAIEQAIAERLFSRLLAAVITGCGKGEVLHGRFSTEAGVNASNHFRLTLPEKLAAMSESELLGTGPSATGYTPTAPLLGLGFSLRLVRNLARNVGGSLRFQKESLLVSLPAVNDSNFRYRHNWSE